MKKVHCNNCDWDGTEKELEVINGEDTELCPECGLKSEGKIMDIDE